jgi:hypothetical protein
MWLKKYGFTLGWNLTQQQYKPPPQMTFFQVQRLAVRIFIRQAGYPPALVFSAALRFIKRGRDRRPSTGP